MFIAAHRGTRLHAPENSRQALISAYVAGADVLEFDLQITADGQLVLSHDDSVDRLTGKEGRIRDMTLKELRWGDLDFSETFNPRNVQGFRYYRGGKRLQIEVFQDILDLLPDNVHLLIDLKHHATVNDAETRRRLVSAYLKTLLERNATGRVVTYSKDHETLSLLRNEVPELRIAAFDWELSPDEQFALMTGLKADGLVTDVSSVLGPDNSLTDFGEALAADFRDNRRSIGAVLYPFRKPGVFTQREYEALISHNFVWSLSTDSLEGAEVEGEYMDVRAVLDREFRAVEDDFAGTEVNRDRWSFGYAKANEYCEVYQDDGVHVRIDPYTGLLPTHHDDTVEAKLADLHNRLLFVEKDWPYYSGGGIGTVNGLTGDFRIEVDYEVTSPMTQATTLELAVLNVDPGRHQANRPKTFRDKDSFYDPHGAPPYVGTEHDEDDGYRINWNLGSEYDSNQYGSPVGDGKIPQKGRLRLDRRGPYFASYYKNDVEAREWICVGVIRNDSLNSTVFARCVAKRWRQERADDPDQHWPIIANTFSFRNLTIDRRKN